jgi:hypothetical protein
MGQLGAILFPHASLPEKVFKRVLSFFGPLKICQPWYMDRVAPFPKEGLIRILRPPPEFRPSPDFAKLLIEYRTWIRTTHKKGFDAFIAFRRERLSTGEALWDIRGSLRSVRNSDAVPFQEKILKWNLMLHLAQEIEDQGREADWLLADLRKSSSPLGDLLQEEVDTVHPLADLLRFDKEFSRNSIDQVLEAWISLFEGQIEADDLLVTFSGDIFDRLGEKWEEGGGEAQSPVMELRIPDFSDLDLGELAEAKSRFLESERGTTLRNSIMKCRKDVPIRPPEEAFSRQICPYHNMMKIILRCFPHVPFSSGSMSRFSGKRVCLIKEEHSRAE